MPTFMKYINTIARCTTQYRNEKLIDTEINGCQCVYILNVCQHPGISQDELAESIYINKSNVTRQLTLLEERGIFIRKTSEVDHRVIEVYPTQKALDLLPIVRKMNQEWNSYITSELSEEEKVTFLELLVKITAKSKSYFDNKKEK